MAHTDCDPVDSVGHRVRERCSPAADQPRLLGPGEEQSGRIRFVESLGKSEPRGSHDDVGELCALNETDILAIFSDLRRGNRRMADIPVAADHPTINCVAGDHPQQELRRPYPRRRVDDGPTQHRPVDEVWLGRQQLHPHLGPEREPHHVRPTAAHPGANELCHRIGSSAHLEWSELKALAVLRKIGNQTMVSLHSLDHGLPGPAAHLAAVKKNNSGRPDRTAFAHEQIHVSDGICLPRTLPERTGRAASATAAETGVDQAGLVSRSCRSVPLRGNGFGFEMPESPRTQTQFALSATQHLDT